jgi:GNAT superfamily N-acetyltransferase
MTQLVLAQTNDIVLILNLMESFYLIDGYPFHRVKNEKNLNQLIDNQHLGRMFLVMFEEENIGYLALTFGFSFEYGGRDAFIDEFFIVEAFRGKGIGKTVLQLLEPLALAAGVQTLHLEVEPHNTVGNQLYLKAGFKGNDRILLNKAINK